MLRLVTASVFGVLTLSVLAVFAGTAEKSATLLAAQAAPPGPVAADPARYAVLYENDVALCISGAVTVEPLGVDEVATSSFARPKSSTFTVPSALTLMLLGFRSRWTMP